MTSYAVTVVTLRVERRTSRVSTGRSYLSELSNHARKAVLREPTPVLVLQPLPRSPTHRPAQVPLRFPVRSEHHAPDAVLDAASQQTQGLWVPSGYPDSNWGPLPPEGSALAKLRYSPSRACRPLTPRAGVEPALLACVGIAGFEPATPRPPAGCAAAAPYPEVDLRPRPHGQRVPSIRSVPGPSVAIASWTPTRFCRSASPPRARDAPVLL